LVRGDTFISTKHLSDILLQLVVGLAFICHKMLVLYSRLITETTKGKYVILKKL